MTQTIQNGISNLENLFAVNVFQIPQYQRAYSWENDHWESFLEDLRQQVIAQENSPTKEYFLGTFLLHEDSRVGNRITNIVDGQQRMTTAVIFIATALSQANQGKFEFSTEKPALLKRNFILDEVSERQKFHTIEEDDVFFRSNILDIAAYPNKTNSPSSKRLEEAKNFFIKHVQSKEWEPLVYALKTAKVMLYSVDSAADATQIFELQNDRGKSLTNLEALKSFLMHCVYLHSEKNAEDHLRDLQTKFSNIFRTIESMAGQERVPDEDQLLAHHCAAFLKWSIKEYNKPKHLVKTIVKETSRSEVISWIEIFVSSLLESYQAIKEMFNRRDKLPEFSELLLLGRMSSYWPLILKTWRYDKSQDKKDFLKTCRLLEVFTFRGYAISNLRVDTSISSFQTVARDFVGEFSELFKHLSNMSHWHNLDSRFATGLNNSRFYEDEGGDAIYLLWRYENYLRSQNGKQQPLLSWRDFVDPIKYATKFSVEHVAARENDIADTTITWGEESDLESFCAVALHRLGNLVIDSISPNSSKGNKDFANKLKSLSENSIYLSQGELINFVDRETLIWDEKSILARHKHLIEFALRTWNPDTYYKEV
jgi:uncharacterized protein with ParB-like and HNH nuclease domain